MGLFNFLKSKPIIQYDSIYETLNLYTDVSLMMPKINNSKLFDDESKHPIIFGYFMGVMKHISKKYNLNDATMFSIYSKHLTHKFANDNQEKGAELLLYSTQLSTTVLGQKYMDAGEISVQSWLAGSELAPHKLSMLLKENTNS